MYSAAWAGWGESPSPHHPGVSSSKQRATLPIEHQPCIISLHTLRSKVKGHITPRCLLVCVQSGPPLWSQWNKALWWGTSPGSCWGIRRHWLNLKRTQIRHIPKDDSSWNLGKGVSETKSLTPHCLLKPLRVTLSPSALCLHQKLPLFHYLMCVFPTLPFFIAFHLGRCIATWKQPVVDGQSSSAEKMAAWTSRERGKSTRWWDDTNAHRRWPRIQTLIRIY